MFEHSFPELLSLLWQIFNSIFICLATNYHLKLQVSICYDHSQILTCTSVSEKWMSAVLFGNNTFDEMNANKNRTTVNCLVQYQLNENMGAFKDFQLPFTHKHNHYVNATMSLTISYME